MGSFILNFRKLGKKEWRPWPWLLVGLLLILPLLLLEIWVGQSLFNYVSYTNSRNMDPQIQYFEDRRDWEYVAIGSSEAKWGIVPSQINAALATKGIQTRGFNLGLDGFSDSYYAAVLPLLDLPARLPRMRVALVGINIIEQPQLLPHSFDQGFPCNGLLQRAILNSAFAQDYGLYPLCNSQKWPAPLVNALENVSNIVRYRQGLRSLLLGSGNSDLIPIASNGLTQYPDGFYAHKPIKDNQKEAEIDYQNFLKKKVEEPQEFGPIAADFWPTLLAPDGFFDQWAGYFERNHILPVFFALPTNPVMIDERNRRADYLRNSQLMRDWAAERTASITGPTFVDLGIKDDYDPTADFADYRHLSEAGARKFSRELGEAIAQQPKVVRALTNNPIETSTAAAIATIRCNNDFLAFAQKSTLNLVLLGYFKNHVKNTAIGRRRAANRVYSVPGFGLIFEQKAAIVHHFYSLCFAKVGDFRIHSFVVFFTEH